MQLPSQFLQLPLAFDVERMRDEVAQFVDHEWRPDRFGVRGYWSLNLVAHRGELNEECQYPPMAGTPALARCPYLRQVLAAFEAPLAEVRLRWLEPDVGVPEHYDSSYAWFHRFRLHVPIQTSPVVDFVCDGKSVHMSPGQAWLFDRLAPHSIKNTSQGHRIHLIIDTVGSAALFDFIERAQKPLLIENPKTWPPPHAVCFDPAVEPVLTWETTPRPTVLDPGSLDVFLADLAARARASTIRDRGRAEAILHQLTRFSLQWRSLHAMHGDDRTHWLAFKEAARAVYQAVRSLEMPEPPWDLDPGMTQRLGGFLHSGAYVPQDQGRPASIDHRSVLHLDREILYRLDPDGQLHVWNQDRYDEAELGELLLLSEFARGATASDAARACGVAFDSDVFEVVQGWVEAGVLAVSFEPEVYLELEEDPMPPGATGAEDRADARSDMAVSSTNLYHLPRPIHFRLIKSGQVWLWAPSGRDYRLGSVNVVLLLAQLVGERTLTEACAEAGVACDDGALGVIAKALSMGVVAVA